MLSNFLLRIILTFPEKILKKTAFLYFKFGEKTVLTSVKLQVLELVSEEKELLDQEGLYIFVNTFLKH